jgi:hypothetical protein
MKHLTSFSAGLIDEIVLIDLVTMVLSVATVSILWYVVKKAFPDEVSDLQFFLTFILVGVPFVMLIYFGMAVINYDAFAASSGWPQLLPITSPFSPLIVGTVVFYIGQTVWLWLGWRKQWMPRSSAADRGLAPSSRLASS